MRIGITCPYSFDRPGGVQGHVVGLGEYLVEQGHEVGILAPGVPAPDYHDRPVPTFTSAGPAFPIPFNGSVARIAYSPRTAVIAKLWLERGGFDVVHVHEPLTPSIAWQVVALSPAPVVATTHAARTDVRLHVAAGQVFRQRLNRIDDVIAVSDVAADLAETYLGRRPRIVPNGIWVSDFASPSPATPWRGGERPRVTFMGRDEPRKGLDVFLAAVPALQEVGDLELVVAGAAGRELPAGVRPLHARDDAARMRLLAGTDVFVAPATGGESFGIVLLEALAAGCQVVASDLEAFSAVLGEAGFIFPTGDAEALASGVAAALASPRPPAVLAERAGRFDWSRVGAEVEAVYERFSRA